MNEDYGSDYISISDDDGNEFELEKLMEFELDDGKRYMACLPADGSEEDPNYGIIILRIIDEDGEELLSTPDSDEELQTAYDAYMQLLFDEEAEEDEPED